ncbi:hypothetical protein M433DRAFT_141580 [Acidomyces richmondensis BFW]|nr:hypothetical protein M433DRAFT_141580 [Acidomyces richmondensis BFW]
MSSPVTERYATSCPFCINAQAFPPDSTSPIPHEPDRTAVNPSCYILLSTPHVIAFLDILPMAPGHILLCTRNHYVKLSEQARETAQALGEWLPILSRAMCSVTGVEDWNVVQNNGVRAAQVVEHVHFHLIPRYQEGRRDGQGGKGTGKLEQGLWRSWRMFGRGAREELEDDEGEEMAAALREALKREVGKGVRKAKI